MLKDPLAAGTLGETDHPLDGVGQGAGGGGI